MVKKCIKVPFVEEVTGKSGAQVIFVDTTTESLESTVQDAVDRLMVIGNAQLVKQNFVGLFRSMVAGVMRDGKPRKVEGFLRVYPVFYGAVDLDKGFDPKENGVYLAVELLNEMKLDISKWTFEDVTEGRKAITIESVKGIDFNLIDPVKNCEINGSGLSGAHVVELTFDGVTTTVNPAYVTGDISRMDIAKAAFAPYADEANDGKELTITIRGNFAKASKTVKLICQRIPPTIKSVIMEGYEATPDAMQMNLRKQVTIEGKNFNLGEGDKVTFELWKNGQFVEGGDLTGLITEATKTRLVLSHLTIDNQGEPDGEYWNADTRIAIVQNGVRAEHKIVMHA